MPSAGGLSHPGPACGVGNRASRRRYGRRRTRRREPGPDVLVYPAAPFRAGIEVSGPITPTLYVSSDAKDTDVSVKLIDVYPDGRAYNLDVDPAAALSRWVRQAAGVAGARKGVQGDAAAAHHQQLFRCRASAADRGDQQQLPPL